MRPEVIDVNKKLISKEKKQVDLINNLIKY